ncbi:MAG: hypothetical protein IJR54_04255 [Oscillibacter sp.]|nr:hypothetical protein [Oscillibacter sp.]
MADWKEMYLKMFRASEKAIRILEAAQLECEELYMRDGDGEDECPPDEPRSVIGPWKPEPGE